MLSPSQEAHVKDFANNKEQKEAVKQFIYQMLEPENWLYTLDTAQPDPEYAQRVKAVVKAKKLIETAFEEMDRLIDTKKPKNVTNEAK